jgi:hypothetical protein
MTLIHSIQYQLNLLILLLLPILIAKILAAFIDLTSRILREFVRGGQTWLQQLYPYQILWHKQIRTKSLLQRSLIGLLQNLTHKYHVLACSMLRQNSIYILALLHLAQGAFFSRSVSSSSMSSSSSTIRSLSYRWEMKQHSFVDAYKEPPIDHQEHIYKAASFTEEAKVPEGSVEGAWSVLRGLKEKAKEYEGEGLHHPQKKLVGGYSYPGAHHVSPKINLLIPKHIVDVAATYRLVVAKLFEFRVQGVTQHWLQLGYENVPGQCPCSSKFKKAGADLVKVREGKYSPENPDVLESAQGSCKRGCTEVDSDGDSSLVRLGAAAALGEYLGPGVSVQIGRGGFSSSHSGMVHAFIRLSESSVGVMAALLESATFLIKTDEPSAAGLPHSRILPNFLEWKGYKGTTYRAVEANHRQESQDASSSRHDDEMEIIPVPDGVVTVGHLTPVYHRRAFGKHTGPTAMKFSEQPGSTGRPMDSPRHRAMRAQGLGKHLRDVDDHNAKVGDAGAPAGPGEGGPAGLGEGGCCGENRKMKLEMVSSFMSTVAEMGKAMEKVAAGTMTEGSYRQQLDAAMMKYELMKKGLEGSE